MRTPTASDYSERTLTSNRFARLALLALAVLPSVALAEPGGSEWYISWGYNRDFWAPGDIHVSQPALQNDFTVHHVKASDFPQGVWGNDITVPQFNLRFGWFLERQHEWAIEFSVDHTKYNTDIGQTARVTGIVAGQPVDDDHVLTADYFNYRLHNGANHIMFSLVKRTPLLGDLNSSGSLSLLLKGGAGIMLPHAESTIMGNQSDVGPKKWGNLVGRDSGWWQVNGWTVGGEVALRLMTFRPVFLELSDKVAYAKLYNVPVYQGRADQILWMNAVVVALGVNLNDRNDGP